MGYEGFLKLQTLADEEDDVVDGYDRSDIQTILSNLKSARVNNWQTDSPYPRSTGQWRKLNPCRNFMFMCPELGDYFYNNIKTDVEDAWWEYNFVTPYWMMARYNADVQEGTYTVLFHYHAMFQGAAHAVKKSYDELVKYLDVPAFNVGDMFYIDNLVTAIQIGSAGNTAPSVDAGQNQNITLPDDDVSLDGTVNDDGEPDPPGSVSVTWTKQTGPGTVTFGNDNAVDTTATFSTSGVYSLRLTASDSELSNYDEVTITVNSGSDTTAHRSLN